MPLQGPALWQARGMELVGPPLAVVQALRTRQQLGASDREIVVTGVLDAPRALVFTAWTRPEHIARWWGPNGFTTTIHEMDVRPGGVWGFIRHGPDAVDYKNRIVYTEVKKPDRLAYVHGADDKTESRRFRSPSFVV